MPVEGPSTITIRTPEGIVFPLLPAGPLSRSLAWTVDLAAVSVVSGTVGKVALLLDLVSRGLGQAVYVLSYFLISVGYGMALEWLWRGQTLGKRLLRLRVMDAEGLSLRFGQIALRNLLRSVDMLPACYLVGGVSCLATRRSQRLGDVAANTIVVRTPRIAEPDLEQILAGKYNSFLDQPHLAGRLRQKASPREAYVALEALLRREDLSPEARVGLFRDIAARFRGLVEFPPAATFGLTDEQYVRNVVDILFRSHSPKGGAPAA